MQGKPTSQLWILTTKTVQQRGQAYSKMNDIHTQVTCLSVLLEHGSKMWSEQFWAQGIMLSLSSGSQIGRKQQRERGEEKAMQFDLMHICYHLREGMRCVLLCAVCAYSNSLTYMVFSRVGGVVMQLLLPETLVSLVLTPQWPTNCNHEWLHEDNTRLWHQRYCWKTYCNVNCTYLMRALVSVSLTLTFFWGK